MKGKFIIIHADDFGLSSGISKGILHAIRKGVVSSTSVIVQNPYLRITKQLIQKNPRVDWGIHVVISPQKTQSHRAIERETLQQLNAFQQTFRIKPSHIDFHKGFRFNNRVYFTLRMLAMKHELAFRYDNRHHLETGFYGLKSNNVTTEDISVEKLTMLFSHLQAGVTELICHPGWTSNNLKDPYRKQRNIEVKTLTNKAVKESLKNENIQLINFKEYKTLLPAGWVSR